MSFKTLDLAHDVASLVSSINEVVSISSSIYATDLNVKFFRNISSASAGVDLGGYWQSVFDSSPTSSLSTALMDVTYGFHTSSIFNLPVTSTSSQNEKIKVYRNMASLLLGDPNGQFTVAGGSQPECFFIMLKRTLQKDEIKKGATQLILQVSASTGWSQVSASDDGAATNFKQTVGGDFAPLKYFGTGSEIAQVWYQAGIIVVPDNTGWLATQPWSGSVALGNIQASGTINQLVDGLRHGTNGSTPAIDRVNFHNQTNLYSTVYFCRAQNSEFNYSSNPTFVDDNKRIRVTSGSNILQTRTYITTIGMYDANDNLLAVGKVNKPITKSPDNEAIFRIRLDY
jgi:hypothetical protein